MVLSACDKKEKEGADPGRSTMIRGAYEIVDFILRNYSEKVVEVGAGYFPEVALLLSQHLKVVATDKEKRNVSGLLIEKDDVFSPKKDVYEGASLLYSIRPPIEVQTAMGRIAADIGADILIRPLEDEIADLPGFTRTLFNLREARFYLFRLKH